MELLGRDIVYLDRDHLCALFGQLVQLVDGILYLCDDLVRGRRDCKQLCLLRADSSFSASFARVGQQSCLLVIVVGVVVPPVLFALASGPATRTT